LENPLARGERLLFPPLRNFIAAMEAAEELSKFISENQRRLHDIEAIFTVEALRIFPADSEEQHREAGKLVHEKIHRMMHAVYSIEEANRTDEAVSATQEKYFAELRSELLSLTGRPEDYGRYAHVWNRVQARPGGAHVLRASLLMSAVSYFEVLISAIVRAQLTLRPEILRSDEQKYSMRDLEAFTTIEQFREHCSEKMADSLLRGGFEDWMEWFSKRHKLQVAGVTDSVDIVEIFQRRHLLVHNGGVVNGLYLTKVQGVQDVPAVGERLRVNAKYLQHALDLLTAAGVKLVAALFGKLFDDADGRETVDHHLSNMTFGLLVSGRYAVVSDVSKWHLTIVQDAQSRLVAMVNHWLAEKHLHGVETIRAEVAAWKIGTLADRYKLAKLALLDRNEEAFVVVKRLLDSQEMSPNEWRGWPLLEGVREYAESANLQPVEENPRWFDGPHLHAVPVPDESPNSAEPDDDLT
jgi:hypothetical protein